jgi:hypothetical protein
LNLNLKNLKVSNISIWNLIECIKYKNSIYTLFTYLSIVDLIVEIFKTYFKNIDNFWYRLKKISIMSQQIKNKIGKKLFYNYKLFNIFVKIILFFNSLYYVDNKYIFLSTRYILSTIK